MARCGRGGTLVGMEGSLAVVWQECGEEPPAHGRLELRPDRIHLEGTRSGKTISEDVSLDEINETHFGRAEAERIGGRQTLVLDFSERHRALLISSLFGIGTLAELAELLGA